MDMNITDNMKNQWISIDEQKSKIKTIMKSDECKARRKELKPRNIKTMAAFTHHEGVQYKSSQFRVSKNSK